LYSDKISKAQDLIAEIWPGLAENRIVYEAILHLYSDGALIETNLADLRELLEHKTIKIHKTSAKTFKECVYNLLDSFPELTSAKGMLRCYEAKPDFDWQECEKAEIALGNALTQDIYGWQPDFWTLFENENLKMACKLTVIVAN
jgi:hypothetical protein